MVYDCSILLRITLDPIISELRATLHCDLFQYRLISVVRAFHVNLFFHHRNVCMFFQNPIIACFFGHLYIVLLYYLYMLIKGRNVPIHYGGHVLSSTHTGHFIWLSQTELWNSNKFWISILLFHITKLNGLLNSFLNLWDDFSSNHRAFSCFNCDKFKH